MRNAWLLNFSKVSMKWNSKEQTNRSRDLLIKYYPEDLSEEWFSEKKDGKKQFLQVQFILENKSYVSSYRNYELGRLVCVRNLKDININFNFELLQSKAFLNTLYKYIFFRVTHIFNNPFRLSNCKILTGACFPGNPLEGQGRRQFYIYFSMALTLNLYESGRMAEVSSGPPPICARKGYIIQRGVGSKIYDLEDLLAPQNKSLLLEKRNEPESISLKIPLCYGLQSLSDSEEKQTYFSISPQTLKQYSTIKYRGGGNPEDSKIESQIDIAIRHLEEEFVRHKLPLSIQKIEKDGNCLYRAIADQIENNQNEYKTYKEMIHDFIRENADLFQEFIQNKSVEEYLKETEPEGKWGSEIEIWAFELMFNAECILYQSKQSGNNEFVFKQGSLFIPQQLSHMKNTSKNSIIIQLGFVADCHYVSIRNKSPDKQETTNKAEAKKLKNLMKMSAEDIEKSYSKEFIEEFIEFYGKENFSYKKGGGLDWRKAKGMFFEYLTVLERAITNHHEDQNQGIKDNLTDYKDPSTELKKEDENKDKNKDEKEDKNKDEKEIGKKRKESPNQFTGTLKNFKPSPEEDKKPNITILEDLNRIYGTFNQAIYELDNRMRGKKIEPFLTKENISAAFNKKNFKFRNDTDKSLYSHIITTIMVSSLDDRIENLEKKMKNDIEAHLNTLVNKEKDYTQKINQNQEKIDSLSKKLDEIQVLITDTLNYQNNLKNHINKLEENNLSLEKSFVHITEQINTIKKQMEETKEKTNMEIEEIKKTEQSFSESNTKEYFSDLEDKFNKLSLEIFDERNKNIDQINTSKIKIEDLFKKTHKTLEKMQKQSNDKEGKVSDFRTEIEKKINELSNYTKDNVKQILEKVNNFHSTKLASQSEWDKIMEELKKVKECCNTSDGKLIKVTDTINEKLVPCIVETLQETKGNSDRIHALWNYRSIHKKGKEEEKEIGVINTEPLDQILSAKKTTKNLHKIMKFIPINGQSKKLAEDLQEGHKYKIHLEIAANQEKEEGFFRNVYVQYGDYRKKAKLYIEKIRGDSTSNNSRRQSQSSNNNHNEQGLGEKSLSPGHFNH